MVRESQGQKKTVGRVMHAFAHHELESHGKPVKNRRQAVAIALSEAGASRAQTPSTNKRRLQHTKGKERSGETAREVKERNSATRAELYAQARRRKISGRSHMSKAELERALRR